MPLKIEKPPVDSQRRGLTVLFASLPVAGLLHACGGGGEGRLRVANASVSFASADVLLDDAGRTSVLAQSVSGYFGVDSEESSHRLRVRAGGSDLAQATLGVAQDEEWTALFAGDDRGYVLVTFAEGAGDAGDNKYRARVFNGTALSTFDVYLTASTTALSSVAATVSGAARHELGEFRSLDSGSYRLRVTSAGNRSEVRLDTTVSLGSRGVGTLVVFASTSGRLLSAALLPQAGDPQLLSNPKARLRYVNALASSASIAPTLDGTATGSGSLAARSATSYVEVDVGSRSVGATVGGVSRTVTSSLSSATDSTCALYGAEGSPKVLLLADDNRAPTASGQASLRLVHLVDGVGALSVSIDQGSPTLETTAGVASDRLQVTADTVRVDVLDASGASVASIASVDLVDGAVYTLFAVADGSGVAALWRRDV